jgi:hypothetical protein
MPVGVELFTLNHVLRGLIETSGERLSDFLNVPTESSLTVSDVHMAPLMALGKGPPVRLGTASLEKRTLLLAIPREQDLTHKSLYRRATRQEYGILVLLPNFELRGNVHLTERLDVRRLLIDRTHDFIPITNASATFIPNPDLVFRTDVIIFNKTAVSLTGALLRGGEAPARPPDDVQT